MLDIAAKIISDAQKVAAMKLRDHFSSCRTFARGIDGDGKYQNGGLDDCKRLVQPLVWVDLGIEQNIPGFGNVCSRRLIQAPTRAAAAASPSSWRTRAKTSSSDVSLSKSPGAALSFRSTIRPCSLALAMVAFSAGPKETAPARGASWGRTPRRKVPVEGIGTVLM
jgi:hypothetical protein